MMEGGPAPHLPPIMLQSNESTICAIAFVRKIRMMTMAMTMMTMMIGFGYHFNGVSHSLFTIVLGAFFSKNRYASIAARVSIDILTYRQISVYMVEYMY